MKFEKAFMIFLMAASAIFVVLIFFSFFIVEDITTFFLMVLQEIMYISLAWLAWKNYKAREPIKIEVEEERRKK
jgi:hypothetical protein